MEEAHGGVGFVRTSLRHYDDDDDDNDDDDDDDDGDNDDNDDDIMIQMFDVYD